MQGKKNESFQQKDSENNDTLKSVYSLGTK